ncbi:MAG: UbiD family decarboxylase [Chloroflexi bacterium]|nr:UbiD family decarboxylase [Chloroflexota bacterium]
MASLDMRAWIDRVRDMNQLEDVRGADWDLEVGAVAAMVHAENPRRPAILFDHLEGYPPGYRVLTGISSSLPRLAMTLGLPIGLTPVETARNWRAKSNSLVPIPPRFVSSGPVLENVHTGEDINLFEFPAPKWHEHDGGRYIGTGGVVITRDPDEGWVNLGTYRVMIQDERTLTVYTSPGKHALIHREKFFSCGKPCPVVICFGQHPLFFLAGMSEVPWGLSEYDYAGAICGEAIEVVKGQVTGLPIPAYAEIAVEGEILPGDTRLEGPFGEALGYYASGEHREPTVVVHRVLHRDDPIICGVPPSRPPNEETFARTIMKSAMIWDEVEKAGIPEIAGVWCHEIGIARLFNVISIKQRYPGHAKQAALSALSCHAGAYMARFIVVVDEDIDPSNLNDVMWAVTTRADPERSIDIVRRCWSGPLDAAIPKDQRGFNSVAVIDACKPYEWIKDFPRTVDTSPALRARVREKFGPDIFR